MRGRLEHVDDRLDRASFGARFYTRVALSFRALDALPATRAQIASLSMAPQDAIKIFTEIIGCLLAVGFEVADLAADPSISRALIALVNFAQGIDTVSNQLESARGALAERKTVERAKGLLMKSRRLSEKEAYALLRETAMNQNKRIVEIAETLLSSAEILKA